ncbi:MAG TPA: DegV family protein [Firmicutes bacterium]|jgi:DegV family protein with EDD domain|nr:DegV family protein [Bacillota bacterium]HHT42414.1 DegV family protein [Bacillota bacterium]
MQEKIAIVTDSTSDIPREIVEQYDIRVIPLRILYQDREYRDQIDITADEVYRRLEQEVPTTSLPAPGDVLALFEQLKSEGFTHVLAIHISSGLSGTAQLISHLAGQVEDMVIRVVDSRSISMGLGYTVIEAARKLTHNVGFEALCTHVQAVLSRMKVYFVLETLEYLKKGGRIGRVAGTLGQILNLKPIITVNEDGVYTTYAKVRGRKQSLERLMEVAKEHLAKPMSNVAVCHGAALEEARDFVQRIKNLGNVGEVLMGHVSPVIGVHTGPGTLGFVVYQTD